MKARAWQRLAAAGALACALAGCRRSSGGQQQGAGATGSPPASGSAPVASSAPEVTTAAVLSAPPSGGVASWEAIEAVKECSLRSREIDPNLAYASLSVAAKKDFAATRFLRSGSRKEGQLAFGGYDTYTRSISTSYGLGKAQFRKTWVFPRPKEDWTVMWFDAQGLVFTRAGWSPTASKLGRFPAIVIEEAERVALSATTIDGPLLAVSPLSPEPNAQLGIYLFVPGEEQAEVVKVVGATHHAVRPRSPAAMTSADGYFVAWVDELRAGTADAVVVTRFDANGKELGPQLTVSTPGRAAREPSLITTDAGVLVAWTEKNGDHDEVAVQAIDKEWRPVGGSRRVDQGSGPSLVGLKSGAVLGMVRQVGGNAHAAVVQVSAAGQPAARGLLLSPPDKPKDAISEPPAMALSDEGVLGVVFLYNEGMRSQMRTLKPECLGP